MVSCVAGEGNGTIDIVINYFKGLFFSFAVLVQSRHKGICLFDKTGTKSLDFYFLVFV